MVSSGQVQGGTYLGGDALGEDPDEAEELESKKMFDNHSGVKD